MLIQVVSINIKRGKEDEFEFLVKSIVPLVKEEKGTLKYTIHRSREAVGTYLFYEIYTDEEAKKVHLSKPYVKEMFKAVDVLLAGEPTISLYEEII